MIRDGLDTDQVRSLEEHTQRILDALGSRGRRCGCPESRRGRYCHACKGTGILVLTGAPASTSAAPSGGERCACGHPSHDGKCMHRTTINRVVGRKLLPGTWPCSCTEFRPAKEDHKP